MSSPLEFRYYLRLLTLDDIRQGAQPLKLPQGPQGSVQLFASPALQWRYRERIQNGDALSMRWSDWQDVPLVREGDDIAALQSIDIPPELRPS